jgi:hypothetical protein
LIGADREAGADAEDEPARDRQEPSALVRIEALLFAALELGLERCQLRRARELLHSDGAESLPFSRCHA